ncbi:hypothetical protein [Ramlibacter sp.]|uniref:hypothetical protein n=1 Tax=Ramlibacter sp. TaxID=1917967 RepID=UPI0017C29431|nr:hypothetical protein [Ramlibacter sp.]MBA2675066.1 hypothetical protein [Ramlibacter sp.]
MTLSDPGPHQVLWAAAMLLVGVNAAVCITVARSGIFSRAQIVAQAVLVWTVPVLGAALVGTFLWAQRSPSLRRTSTEPMQSAGLGDGSLDGDGHAP